ncbi:MAG: nuclear transport factor 2 family protein [Deltaproteobacteria bacterium]|nr:nuclear transport factor 2 family protein [Deltaproteobacteria bacterium]
MTRAEFDRYLRKFNAADYDGFLEYYADDFEMLHVGGHLRGREEVLSFYAFLHAHVRETVLVDHFVSDEHMIALEARVRLECRKELTAEAIAASAYPRLEPLAFGQVVELPPQFIHYHLRDGKFMKVECRECP